MTQTPQQVILIFGAAGDLTERKLIPALYNLYRQELLEKDLIIIGVSRTQYSNEAIREHYTKKAPEELSKQETWPDFISRVFYEPFDANNLDAYQALKQRINSLTESGRALNVLYYLATAPSLFNVIAENLSRAGLSAPEKERAGSKARLVIEKPFGKDLATAKALNKHLQKFWKEKQLFRIDHYLGKETVQNILVFRFANSIFEPLWNRHHIDRIEISVCESIGVEDRADYFDKSGIVRDMVQNHLLQMLSLLCIEPPQSLSDADSIRSEKVKVLKSIKKFSQEEVRNKVIRAQYLGGEVEGERVIAYQDIKGVDSKSLTETYVSMQLEIDNWRWGGVPIYIRAGKRLNKRLTSIAVHFKNPPLSSFQNLASSNSLEPESSGAVVKGKNIPSQNVLIIQVQPNEGISLQVNSKMPGLQMNLANVHMDFSYKGSFANVSADAYERLLLDAFKGDATLFTRDDEIEQAWSIIDPILKVWENAPYTPMYYYQPGSWGPREAELMLAKNKHTWLDS